MPGPAIENETPWAAELSVALDEQGVENLVVLVQASFALPEPGGRDLVRLEKQPAIALGGLWNGAPGLSSYRSETQIAPYKLATDVCLVGHAYPEAPGQTQVTAGLKVGPVSKVIRVFGDRLWLSAMGEIASRPRPFDKMPLKYELAFGGTETKPDEPSKRKCERRNPVGVGYCSGWAKEGARLPNLEDPKRLMSAASDKPPPAGFGLLCPDWQPRAAYAGTYGEKWLAEEMPRMPADFDRRFFNAAHPDLIAHGFLRGDEDVVLMNVTPQGQRRFRLPGTPPPLLEATIARTSAQPLQSRLDTISFDTDAMTVSLMWRAGLPLRRGLHEVGKVLVAPAETGSVCR